MDAKLSESAYGVNAAVYSRDFCDALRVVQPGDKKWKSELQRTFARRLQQEMDLRRMSQNAVARNARSHGYDIAQSTISRVLDGKQDPGLEIIEATSAALGLPAWYLITEDGEQRVIKTPAMPKNVVSLASPYPKIMTKSGKPEKQDEKTRSREKRRRA